MAQIQSSVFEFLRDLQKNNNRDWFQENKHRFEEDLRVPLLAFISAFAKPLAKISKEYDADPRPRGGSLFRIYRDVRFSRDKTPYKTHAGIWFKHKKAKDVHAPGYYLHLHPQECFVGVGIWHPDSVALKRIRDKIVADGTGWKRASRGRKFTDSFELSGDSLKRPPRGYDKEHPLIEDLKRKDFIAVADFTPKEVLAKDFMKTFAASCRAATPLMKYLNGALKLKF